MNTNTLRFGVARTAVLSVVLAAAAFYAGNAHADGLFVAQRPTPELTAALTAEVQAELRAQTAVELDHAANIHADTMLAALRAARVDLLSKVAASALGAPRGFVLVMPAALAQPTL